MADRDIVVIGGSNGAISALRTIVAVLPAGFPAAVFVVIHTSQHSPQVLAELLNRAGPIPVLYASDRMLITPGQIYVARPGQHLQVKRGWMKLSAGPKENRHRPSIDTLFRSAAASYGPRTIGVVLTGNLDDGSAGLRDIKQRGGLAIVQDPDDAVASSMPLNAIESANPDYVLPATEIGTQLETLVTEPVRETIRFKANGPISNLSPTQAVYSCPECGGTLTEINEQGVLRFRCRVGHRYSGESLLEDQADAVERALWAAIRSLEEHSEMAGRLAERWSERNHNRLFRHFSNRSAASEEHAKILRQFLESTDEIRESPPEKATGT